MAAFVQVKPHHIVRARVERSSRDERSHKHLPSPSNRDSGDLTPTWFLHEDLERVQRCTDRGEISRKERVSLALRKRARGLCRGFGSRENAAIFGQEVMCNSRRA